MSINKEKLEQQNIVIYQDSKGNVELKADVEKETIWGSQAQIAGLFETTPQNITLHLKAIYGEKELDKSATCKKSLQVQMEGKRSVERLTELYNLDAIIAVGYRVNSKKATQFRIWATKTLREYIVKGIAVNEDRIKKIHEKGATDIAKKVEFIQRTLANRQLDMGEVSSLLSVIKDYASSWTLLQKYDEGGLEIQKSRRVEKKKFDYDFVLPQITGLKTVLMKKGEASDLFANERDGSFQGILKTIYQSFGGRELYGSLEEKAAHLLYFIIKDHPFSDGNKRTAAFLFTIFLKRNRMKMPNESGLVALTLLIASSDPKEKESMVALVTNLIA